MEYTLTKYALGRIAEELGGYYKDMEWSRSEIARGCFSMSEEASRLQKAILRIETAKNMLYNMGIDFNWDGEKIKLFSVRTEEQLA